MRSVQQKVLLVLLFLLCFYGLYASFMRGSANAWYYKAEFSLREWIDEGGIPDQQRYDEALLAIKKAQSLDSGHPHYAHILGRIQHWGVESDYESIDKLPEIKQWYLKSSELRPLWPNLWIDLALLNDNLEGYSSETMEYLEQALLVGPYNDSVVVGSIGIWLNNWSVLSGSDRAKLFKQFSIAVNHPKLLKEVLILAQQIGRENILCIQLRVNPDYKKKALGLAKKYCQ